ncbi:hypothetical protein F4779DRAFT_364022 [Xylariaceae sp. FL0662B]|nr:hypothetical protein F4779DRAFT_364022 [Xylariaceae sp. FL0662B]
MEVMWNDRPSKKKLPTPLALLPPKKRQNKPNQEQRRIVRAEGKVRPHAVRRRALWSGAVAVAGSLRDRAKGKAGDPYVCTRPCVCVCVMCVCSVSAVCARRRAMVSDVRRRATLLSYIDPLRAFSPDGQADIARNWHPYWVEEGLCLCFACVVFQGGGGIYFVLFIFVFLFFFFLSFLFAPLPSVCYFATKYGDRRMIDLN